MKYKKSMRIVVCEKPTAKRHMRICAHTNKILIAIAITGVLGLFCVSSSALAYTYTPMEKLPGFGLVKDFPGYVSAIIKFSYWTIGIAAVLMMTIGGFYYMTSAGNNSRMETAKGIIWDAILGVAMVMISWLLLYVLNPQLIGGDVSSLFDKPLPAKTIPVSPTKPVQEEAGDILATAKLGKVILAGSASCAPESAPVYVVEDAAKGKDVMVCSQGCTKTSGCSRKNVTLNPTMLNATSSISSNYQKLTVTSITGGSHAASSPHYTGNGMDVVPTTNNASAWNNVVSEYKKRGLKANCDLGGKFYNDCAEIIGKKGAHIDVKS